MGVNLYIFAKNIQVSWSVLTMRNQTSQNQTPIKSFYYWLHGWVILGKLTSARFGAIKYCIKCSILLRGEKVLKRNQFQAILCQIFPICGDMVESVVSAKSSLWYYTLWPVASQGQWGMLTLAVLEIPDYRYTTLSRNLIGCSSLSQEYCKLIGW